MEDGRVNGVLGGQWLAVVLKANTALVTRSFGDTKFKQCGVTVVPGEATAFVNGDEPTPVSDISSFSIKSGV